MCISAVNYLGNINHDSQPLLHGRKLTVLPIQDYSYKFRIGQL